MAAAVTFPVTKTADTADGACNADCSLREAIIAANSLAGADTITVPAGTYLLTIAGSDGEDASANGDLDITSDLTISGAGAATTIVDGNGTNRVFEIFVGPVSFSGLTIRNGLAAGFGGGINNRSTSTVTITNSVISNNQANGFGGGVNNNGAGTVSISNSSVTGNTALGSNFGGGINNNFGGTATVTLSTISSNTAADGGGINNNSSGSFTLTDSTVSGNTGTDTSPGGGGILNNSSGPMTIVGSTVSGNTSVGPGGGINNNSGGALAITNSTVSNNTSTNAGGGGGVYRGSIGTVALTNVTVIGNSAPLGGGLRNNRGDSPITLLRSIVANSVSGGSCSGVISSLGNNLSSDATCNLVAAGDLPNTNPLAAPLAANGGPTQTHALQAGSPAINAGGAGCPPPAIDQRGVTRPQGSACEIGSFECQTGECAGLGATPTPTPTGAPPTATPTGVPPTATPTGVPPTLTPTSVPTAPGGPPANVPMLSWPLLALLAIGIAGTGYFLVRRG
jgi:CSLREA domain-containing protein